MCINVNEITTWQKYLIEKELPNYKYIMHNWQTDDEHFRQVYYKFYLSASHASLTPQSKNSYFEVLHNYELNLENPRDNLINIVGQLYSAMDSHRNEFSFASKLLHTRNDSFPIYDSKVRKYLSNLPTDNQVQFTWKQSNSSNALDEIKDDWAALCDWYDRFLASEEGVEWVNWFDESFPAYSNISDIKKVDFIIFVGVE